MRNNVQKEALNLYNARKGFEKARQRGTSVVNTAKNILNTTKKNIGGYVKFSPRDAHTGFKALFGNVRRPYGR